MSNTDRAGRSRDHQAPQAHEVVGTAKQQAYQVARIASGQGV